MSNCVRCPGKYSSYELDKLLIPVCIKNMTYAQQCKYVLTVTPESYQFREKAKLLFTTMMKASQNINRGSCANPFHVNWNSCNGKFFIGGKSLASYYCHYLGSNKGFSGLLRKIIEAWERQTYVKNLVKNGKYCRPGNRC